MYPGRLSRLQGSAVASSARQARGGTRTPRLALAAMSDETTAKVWLYEADDWQLADDPIIWADGDDVMEKYAEAGYSEYGSPAT